jgi:RHS repeat-associated protein
MRSTCSTLISSYPQRHWYQGDYSELDPETGLQAFDLRMYSSRIGRWLSVDPYAQYWSPYLAMGNNPVGMIDPDGGYSKFGAWWRSGFNSNNISQRADGEWGVYTGQSEFRYFEPELNMTGTGVQANYDYGSSSSFSGGSNIFRTRADMLEDIGAPDGLGIADYTSTMYSSAIEWAKRTGPQVKWLGQAGSVATGATVGLTVLSTVVDMYNEEAGTFNVLDVAVTGALLVTGGLVTTAVLPYVIVAGVVWTGIKIAGGKEMKQYINQNFNINGN